MPNTEVDERHEIQTGEKQEPESSKVSRRKFLVIGGASGLTLGFAIQSGGRKAFAQPPGIAGPPAQTQVNTFLNITSSGVITLTIGSSEMGQGSFSGLAQILSEDLMAVSYTHLAEIWGIGLFAEIRHLAFSAEVWEPACA